ncbi:NAD(P)-dependent oxidoreductase [Rufibacter tibetensis]|uniref:Epimerase n=1 Tax=Rufibacter tibetensis TaxID=512763 RepID=A0A0P0C992_9BACT|nr:SDR family oxidoreductase [Rufibacter tibetensis]ALJ01691.1 epimerase [Rufibacter tibetensis]
MKLIVFGSTGSVGKQVVRKALEQGFNVTAFCRNKSKLEHPGNQGMRVFTGDVFNAKAVEDAIAGHDAVCVVLGSGKGKASLVRSEGTRNVISGMKRNSVDRLVCQTTLGAGNSRGNLNFFWKKVMFGWLLKKVYLDHELQEEYVMASGLSWTLVRPAAFTDGEETGHYRHGFSPDDKTTKLKISRRDIAGFLIKELSGNHYIHQTPGLSY